MNANIEYGSKGYWKIVLSQEATRHDSAGRELLVVAQGAAGLIFCTPEYAGHRLKRA